jgi:4-amino-4-deoxy-L-arabinose transferase-like glycosyltransferase
VISAKTEKWCLICVLVLAAFLRLYKLETNPLWYTDEANYVGVADFLLKGEVRYGAILYPFATEQLPQPVLFFLLNGIFLRLFGVSMLSARLLSALLGIAALFPLYAIGKRTAGAAVGLLAALLFTIHFYSVLFLRWGMPYNLCMFFNILTLYFIVLYEDSKEPGALLAAAGSAGLAALSSFFGLATVLFVCCYAALKDTRRCWQPIMLSILPSALFFLWGMHQRGGAFLRDFALLFTQMTPEEMNHPEQARIIAHATLRFASYDFIYYFGILGLVLWGGRGRVVLVFFLFLIPLIIKKQGLDPSVKYNAPTYLFCIHLGFAYLMVRLYGSVRRRDIRKALVAVFAIVLAAITATRIYQVATHIPSGFEAVGSVESIPAARTLADYVNDHTSPSDFVIAPERVYWMLHCQTANLYQAVAHDTGGTTWHYRITPDRYAFDCSYKNAKFIILDHTDRTIILHPSNPNMDYIPRKMKEENWQAVFLSGEYQVFENPRRR